MPELTAIVRPNRARGTYAAPAREEPDGNPNRDDLRAAEMLR